MLGIVAFGAERVPEEATLESFYAPGGGLEFFTAGHSPVSLEILSTAKYVDLGGAGGFGPKLITEVPLVETVPGAPDASVETINVKVGSAIKKGKEDRLLRHACRRRCPKGGFAGQDRTDLRRGSAASPPADRDGDLQGAVPEEDSAAGGSRREART